MKSTLMPSIAVLPIGVLSGLVISANFHGGLEVFSPPNGWVPSAEHPLTTNQGSAFSAIADFNNDGYTDVVCLTPNSPTPTSCRIDTFSGDGTGSWTPSGMQSFGWPNGWDRPTTQMTGSADPWQLHTADVNADGWVDLVLVVWDTGANDSNNQGPLGVATYLNTAGSGFRCVGDVTSDGMTETNDILKVIDDWGCIQGE